MMACRRAMVMAAGLGKRMLPLTADKPKPMVRVAGKCLIDHTLDWLAASQVDEVVVNTHYLAPMLEAHLASRRRPTIHISREEVLLETGGGVQKAMPLLGRDPFFIANSDVICLDGATPALERLRSAWRDEAMDVLLLLQPVSRAVGYDGAGDFFLSDGKIRRRLPDEKAPYVFTGVQLLHPRALAHAPSQPIFSLNVIYDALLAAEPCRIAALVHDGAWLHVGDPEGVALAERYLLARR
ncbi:MAG: nucleotidyltransferase family protein [Alphaproteobacteria bacterium]|nr:nucleotidyltransferase family protein [Alphaproteobacteria bacterium]